MRQLPPGISSVTGSDELGSSAAMCYRDTGEVFTNNAIFQKLPKDYQEFIIGHEAGHIVNNTNNEFLADDYAFDWCIKRGISLKNTVLAMTRVLNFPENNPVLKKEQEARVKRQLQRALNYDYRVNNNQKAKPQTTYIMKNTVVDAMANSFLGIGKKAQAKKAVKTELKQEKKAAKVENKIAKKAVKVEKKQAKVNVKNAKATAKVTNANAKQTLASQGVKSGVADSIGKLAAGLGAGLNNFFKPSVADTMAENVGADPGSVTNALANQNSAGSDDGGSDAGNGGGGSGDGGKKGDGKILGMEKKTAILVGVVAGVIIITVILVFAFSGKKAAPVAA